MVATLERGKKTLEPKKTQEKTAFKSPKIMSNLVVICMFMLWFNWYFFRTNVYFVKREDCAYDYIAQGKVCVTCMLDSKCCEYLLFFIGFDKIDILFMD